MRSSCVTLLVTALCSIACPAFADGMAADLPMTEKTLANGLKILVHDHRAPTVSVVIWYGVGSSHDPPERSGFAHLFEHLMLQGSRHVPEDGHFRYLEQAGASYRNATTGVDRTNYWATVPANELDLVTARMAAAISSGTSSERLACV
jgi:zinc protease